jgi:hypothetical protein
LSVIKSLVTWACGFAFRGFISDIVLTPYVVVFCAARFFAAVTSVRFAVPFVALAGESSGLAFGVGPGFLFRSAADRNASAGMKCARPNFSARKTPARTICRTRPGVTSSIAAASSVV